MKIGVMGDLHGNFPHARDTLAAFRRQKVDLIFQVGDFGIGWPGHGDFYADAISKLLELFDQTMHIVPGNHENWDVIDAMNFESGQAWLVPRISVLERNARFNFGGRSFLALGGAPSIDFPARIPGHSWWRTEALTWPDVDRAIQEGHAEIMLTHDAPDGGTDKVQRIIDRPDNGFWTKEGLAYAAEGRHLMTEAYKGVLPKVFVHGHFHVADEKKVGQTQFISLHQDGKPKSSIILDLDTLDFEWLQV